MKTITVDISDKKALVFELDNDAIRDLLPFLVRLGGEPLYVLKDPRMGEVGEPRREIVVEPVPISEPVPEKAPLVPEPA